MTTAAAPASAQAGQDTTPKPPGTAEQKPATAPAAAGASGTPAAPPPAAPQVAPAKPDAGAPAKPADAKGGTEPAKGDASGKPDAAAAPAPEAEPKFELKLPEGSPLDAKLDVEEVVAFAKANKLSPEVAQKLLEERSSFVGSFVTVQKQLYAKEADRWLETSKTHEKYGKQKFPETSERIKRMIETRAPKLKALLEGETRYGDHPDVFEFLAELAWSNANDTVSRPAGAGQGDPPRPAALADRLYGKTGFSHELEAEQAKAGKS